MKPTPNYEKIGIFLKDLTPEEFKSWLIQL